MCLCWTYTYHHEQLRTHRRGSARCLFRFIHTLPRSYSHASEILHARSRDPTCALPRSYTRAPAILHVLPKFYMLSRNSTHVPDILHALPRYYTVYQDPTHSRDPTRAPRNLQALPRSWPDNRISTIDSDWPTLVVTIETKPPAWTQVSPVTEDANKAWAPCHTAVTQTHRKKHWMIRMGRIKHSDWFGNQETRYKFHKIRSETRTWHWGRKEKRR